MVFPHIDPVYGDTTGLRNVGFWFSTEVADHPRRF